MNTTIFTYIWNFFVFKIVFFNVLLNCAHAGSGCSAGRCRLTPSVATSSWSASSCPPPSSPARILSGPKQRSIRLDALSSLIFSPHRVFFISKATWKSTRFEGKSSLILSPNKAFLANVGALCISLKFDRFIV